MINPDLAITVILFLVEPFGSLIYVILYQAQLINNTNNALVFIILVFLSILRRYFVKVK